jgi:hypothetical protein
LLEIVSVPDTIPGVTGANVTFTAVDSPAARVTGEAGGTSANCPGLAVIALMLTLSEPVFATVTVCGELVAAMFTLPKFNELGVTLNCVLAAATPVPESETELGEEGALLESVSVPDNKPAATGANLTFTVADSPAASIKGKAGRVTMVNCEGLAAMALMVTLSIPVFLTVTVCAALVAAMFTLPKFKELGVTLNCVLDATPVPESETALGEVAALLEIASVADTGPTATGAKATPTLADCPATIVNGNAGRETTRN